MRYNIHGYIQDKAIEFGLNNDELLILRHFEDFATSGKMDSFYEDGYMYYWINYDAFLKHLPILGINKVRLGEIINHNLSTEPHDLELKKQTYSEKMINKVKKRKYVGVLKSKLVKNSEVGTRTYFAFTKRFYDLKPDISSNDNAMKSTDNEGGSVKIPNGFSKNTEGGSVKIPNGVRYKNRYKDSTISDSTISDSISTTQSEEKLPVVNTNKELIEKETHLKLNSFNKQNKIKNWDKDRLIKAIEIFKSKEGKYFSLLEKIYNDDGNYIKKGASKIDTPSHNISIYQTKENIPQVKTRFHNINQSFMNYEADELEKMLFENQKKKFGGN